MKTNLALLASFTFEGTGGSIPVSLGSYLLPRRLRLVRAAVSASVQFGESGFVTVFLCNGGNIDQAMAVLTLRSSATDVESQSNGANQVVEVGMVLGAGSEIHVLSNAGVEVMGAVSLHFEID